MRVPTVLLAAAALTGCAAASMVAEPPAAPRAPVARAGSHLPATEPPTGAPLRVRLVDPAPVTTTVGRGVSVRVRWTDGDGVLAGTDAEWGEGVGIGSAKTGPGQCPAPTAQPRSGTVTFRHAWAAPGTYQARLTVVTAACGTAGRTLEEASVTVPVTVTGRSR
mgnify:CR=1 FL=1